MDARDVRTLSVGMGLVGAIGALVGGAMALTFEPLEYRVVGLIVGSVCFAAVLWSVWREPGVLAKTSAVAALFATAAASAFAASQAGVPWPLVVTLAWLAASLVWLRRPPGWSRAHALLDSRRETVFDYEGVHFTIAIVGVPRCDEALQLELTAENCWTGSRTLSLSLASRASLTLAPLEVKRARIALEHGKGSGPQDLMLDVGVQGWRGRRAKPRSGTLVSARVMPIETAALALGGILAWGGGIRMRLAIS